MPMQLRKYLIQVNMALLTGFYFWIQPLRFRNLEGGIHTSIGNFRDL